METLCQRFPHLSKSILSNLDNQSLMKSKEASRDIFQFLENERFYWIRMIGKKCWNFEGFEESWKETIHQTPFDVIKELANVVQTWLTSLRSKWSRPIHPLHVVALQGNLKLYEYVDGKTKEKIPQGRIYCKYGKDGVKFLIPTTGKGSNYQMVKEATPLHMAAMKGNLEVCKYISENSNDEYQRYNLNECETPLNIAAANGHFKVFKILFERLGEKELGCESLSYAAGRGHIEIYQYIQQNVQIKNPRDKIGNTPLHSAAYFGHLNIFKEYFKIVGHTMYINPGDNYGYTPLHHAAEKNQLEVCKFIIEKVDNKNPAVNNDGLTPLNDGRTPLHIAANNGFFEICKLIIANVRNKHPLINDGQTPRDLIDKYSPPKTRSKMLALFDS